MSTSPVDAAHELPVEEDRLHFPWPGPEWLESLWFGSYEPEQGVGFVTLIGFNARDQRSRLWLLFVENGRVVVDATDLNLPLTAPDGDSVTVGGLKLEWLKDLESFRLTYDSDAAAMDVTWSAITPLKRTNSRKPFPGQQELEPYGHSEQAGVIEGSLRIGARTYPIARATSWRDHLWGHAITDGWSEMGWWAWVTGITPEGDLGWNVSAHRFPDGREGLYGFVFANGAIERIRVSHCDVQADETEHSPLSVRFGWTIESTGERYDGSGRVVAPLAVDEPVEGGYCRINDPVAEFTVNGRRAWGTLEMGQVWR